MNKTLSSTLIVFSTIIASPSSYAVDDDTGFYLGIGVQRANFDRGSVASSDTKGNLSAGYMFNDRWGIDGTLYNFVNEKEGNTEVVVAGLALTGVYKIPVSNNIDIYGKAGLMRTGIEVKQGSAKIYDDHGTDLVIGLGAKYDFGKHNISVEYNKVDPKDASLDVVSLGYRYEF